MASALISAVSMTGINAFGSPAKRNLQTGIMWGSIGVGKTVLEKFDWKNLARQTKDIYDRLVGG